MDIRLFSILEEGIQGSLSTGTAIIKVEVDRDTIINAYMNQRDYDELVLNHFILDDKETEEEALSILKDYVQEVI